MSLVQPTGPQNPTFEGRKYRMPTRATYGVCRALFPRENARSSIGGERAFLLLAVRVYLLRATLPTSPVPFTRIRFQV